MNKRAVTTTLLWRFTDSRDNVRSREPSSVILGPDKCPEHGHLFSSSPDGKDETTASDAVGPDSTPGEMWHLVFACWSLCHSLICGFLCSVHCRPVDLLHPSSVLFETISVQKQQLCWIPATIYNYTVQYCSSNTVNYKRLHLLFFLFFKFLVFCFFIFLLQFDIFLHCFFFLQLQFCCIFFSVSSPLSFTSSFASQWHS